MTASGCGRVSLLMLLSILGKVLYVALSIAYRSLSNGQRGRAYSLEREVAGFKG